MKDLIVSFIGGGNMARALIGGLIQTGWPTANIHVSEPSPDQQQLILDIDTNICVYSDNEEAIKAADIVMLAVKPQVLQKVITPLAASFTQTRPLLISIAAGIREHDINRWAGDHLAIVRCMPNTPALVQQGVTGLFANPRTTDQQKKWAESLLGAVGMCVWVDEESQLDAVTALSGSGPAYLFLVMEAMEEAGIKLGLTPQVARKLSIQTALGASTLAAASTDSTKDLRQKVTSPGGTTEQAIHTLEDGGLRELFTHAMQAAAKRADSLAQELGKS